VRLRFVHPSYFFIFTNPLYFFTLSFALPSFFLFFVFARGLNNHLLLHAIILLQVEKASWFP
jgi:hypothetical protein